MAVPAALANRVLAREQWARDSLAAHRGRAFRVIIGPLISAMQIDGSGSIESVGTLDRAADLTLTISPFALPALLADPKRWDEFVREEGDAALAMTLKGLAETLPWFVERAFAQALGPVTGRFIADSMLLLKRRQGDIAWQIAERFAFQNLPVATRQGALFT